MSTFYERNNNQISGSRFKQNFKIDRFLVGFEHDPKHNFNPTFQNTIQEKWGK